MNRETTYYQISECEMKQVYYNVRNNAKDGKYLYEGISSFSFNLKELQKVFNQLKKFIYKDDKLEICNRVLFYLENDVLNIHTVDGVKGFSINIEADNYRDNKTYFGIYVNDLEFLMNFKMNYAKTIKVDVVVKKDTVIFHLPFYTYIFKNTTNLKKGNLYKVFKGDINEMFTIDRDDIINEIKDIKCKEIAFKGEPNKNIKIYNVKTKEVIKELNYSSKEGVFIAFNTKFLLKTLKSLNKGSIEIHYINSVHPIRIHQDNKIALCLPVYIRGNRI